MPAQNNSRRGRKSRRKRNGPSGPLYAAVDLGTNNCRLLVAKPLGKHFRVVDSHSQIARLGEGLEATGRLSDASIERAIDALRAIRQKLKTRGVGNIRCIATEACRRAENGADFVARVQAETGLSFKIISPREEAELALIGCHDLLAPESKHVLVIDVGGGSTELSLVDARKARESGLKQVMQKAPILHWTSLPLGVVTLSETYQHLSEEEAWPAMLEHARGVLSGWDKLAEIADVISSSESHLIGTSGTVTCLAGVHQELDIYRRDKVDGSWLTQDEAFGAISKLRELGLEGRSALPTIGPGRAGLMLSGCAIIQAAWELVPAENLRVADRGLREGLLLSMIHGPKRGSKRRRRRKAGKAPAAAPAAAGAPNE